LPYQKRRARKFYEGTTLAKDITSKVAEQIEPVAHDAERLVELHVDLLRSELRQAAGEVSPALASLGVGAGLATAGGLLGSLALVHGLQRTTPMPLWTCYGLVGGVLGAVGVSLMGSGGRRLSGVSLVPYETLAALKEDLEWVKGTKK
jgi:hypothetical protein